MIVRGWGGRAMSGVVVLRSCVLGSGLEEVI